MTVTDSPAEDIPGVTRRHRPSDFYHERTNFQFIKHTKRWAILSGTLLLLSFVALFARGLNFGIDFKGGTSWQVQIAQGHTASVPEIRDLITPLGFADAKVTTLSGKNGKSINVQEHIVSDPITAITEALATYGGVTPAQVQFAQAAKSGGSFTFTTKSKTPTEEGVKAALEKTELKDATVKVDGKNVTVSAKTLPVSPTERMAIALAKYAGVNKEDVSISTVGPTWGHEVSKKAIQALIYFFILLALYLSVRFEFKMAVAAIIAVIHDIIFTIGVYALFHFEVTPATITAFLTILGFSLYDTVVVFDKVRENQRRMTATGRTTYGEMVNRSLNQVLMRSLSTSFVALMPVLSLLIVGTGIFGAKSLEDFALALAAGLFIGSYSSIFVAAPILAWWKEREPQYRALAERRARLAPTQPLVAATAGAPAKVPVGGGAIVSSADVDTNGGDTPNEKIANEKIANEKIANEKIANEKIGGVPGGPPPMPRRIEPRARQQRRRKRK
jgi:preprotein translocase subunit SecF